MFTRPQAKRVKAVAVAVALASWLSALAFGLLLVLRAHPVALIALALCAVVWVVSLVLAWPLYCPWCCERLFFAARIANSPSWSQVLQQCMPHDIVVKGRLTCPYCRSRFVLPSVERQAASEETAS